MSSKKQKLLWNIKKSKERSRWNVSMQGYVPSMGIMDYQEFKEKILKRLQDFYGDDADVAMVKAFKNNEEPYDAIQISFKEKKAEIIPLFIVNSLYERFASGELSFTDCEGQVVEMRESSRCGEELKELADKSMDWNAVKEQVYPILINTERNKELLDTVANRPFLDLSVVYVIRNGYCRCAHATIKITRKLLVHYGISEEQLHARAMENLAADSYRFVRVDEMIGELLAGLTGIGSGHGTEGKMQTMEQGCMYIFTNDLKLFGAAGMLNKELLRKAAGGMDCFILPSSVHECLAVPVGEDTSQSYYDEKVSSVNRERVPENEVLADHAYYYDAKKGELRLKR